MMYLAFFIISAFCAVNLSHGLSTKEQLVKDANTLVDLTLVDLVKDNTAPLPDIKGLVEDSVGPLKFNTTVNLKNGKLAGLKSSRRIGECRVVSSTEILCPASASNVVATYENNLPVSGSVYFAVIIRLDANERIVKIETTDPLFMDDDVEELYSLFSKVGKFIKKEVKAHAGQIVGKVAGLAVKAGVTYVTGNPTLGQVAGHLAANVVQKQVDKKVNH